jgi:hypothetical protein
MLRELRDGFNGDEFFAWMVGVCDEILEWNDVKKLKVW